MHFLVMAALFCVGQCAVVPSSNPSAEFDKTYVGVVFEPYTKFSDDKRDYQIEEVESMLQLVTSRFQYFSTYGMGTTSPSSTWDSGEANGLSAVAASHINKKMNELKLIVNIGTWHNSNDQIMRQEIANAFTAAELANHNFPGTVNGVIITSYQTYSGGQLKSILKLVADHASEKAQNLSLQLGVRTTNCDALSASLSDVASDLHVSALEMMGVLNFINCVRFPASPSEVQSLGDYYLQVQKEFASFNPNFTVIGETGWSSFDKINKKFLSGPSVKFWIEMAEWAKRHQFRIDMFTAFDEPWKEVIGIHEPHFGWWKRVKNDSSGAEAFQEKISYVEIVPTEDHTLGIGLGIGGAIVFLIMLGGIVYLYKTLVLVRDQLLSQADIDAFEKGVKSDMATDENMEDALRLPYDRSYEIPKRKFLIDTSILLGSGNFGCVYKGKVEGQDDEVAFKLTQSNCTSTTLKSLLSEIKIMIHVGKHPNVVSIVGACTSDIRKGTIMIATELCVGGSLEKRLRNYKAKMSQQPSVTQIVDTVRYANAPTNLPPKDNIVEKCLRWSYEIACGMEHIASKNVIHADLAARNVLLTSDGSAKITDFGLSRRLYEYTNYVKQNQEPLPWRWMSIESLTTMTFSTKSDVWSYAVTLFEIFSLGDTPYPGLSWTVDFANDLENGLRMNKPNLATDEIYSIMCDCWKPLPVERPTFTDLARFFQGLLYGAPQYHEIEEEAPGESTQLLQD